MKLEHLIQAYNFNRISAQIKEKMEDENERAGVISFSEDINASYLLDDEDIVIALNVFCNCLTRGEKTADNQLQHIEETITVLQKTIELLGNIPQKEANMILQKLGLFDETFKKRKANKTYRTYL